MSAENDTPAEVFPEDVTEDITEDLPADLPADVTADVGEVAPEGVLALSREGFSGSSPIFRRPSPALLLILFGLSVALGAAIWLGVLSRPDNCVDRALSQTPCHSDTAHAALLASAPLDSDRDLTLTAADACPDNTAAVALRADALICLGSITDSSWVEYNPPGVGTCVILADDLAPPRPVNCPLASSPETGLVVARLALDPAGPGPANALLERYQLQVDHACELGQPLGPSFFEWRGGATHMLCVVALADSHPSG